MDSGDLGSNSMYVLDAFVAIILRVQDQCRSAKACEYQSSIQSCTTSSNEQDVECARPKCCHIRLGLSNFSISGSIAEVYLAAQPCGSQSAIDLSVTIISVEC